MKNDTEAVDIPAAKDNGMNATDLSTPRKAKAKAKPSKKEVIKVKAKGAKAAKKITKRLESRLPGRQATLRPTAKRRKK